MATKAQEIYDRTHELMGEGVSRTEAFKKIATDTGLKYDSVRGSFYSHKLKAEGGEKPDAHPPAGDHTRGRFGRCSCVLGARHSSH